MQEQFKKGEVSEEQYKALKRELGRTEVELANLEEAARQTDTAIEELGKSSKLSGEELKEATLGKQLGVSRTPVREALRQLDLEGLVEIAPNRGAKVIGISRKDVEDIYHMRARLEGLAARKAAEQIKEEELAELEEVILLSEFHVKKPESKQMVRLDGRFHEIMYRASGSRMLEHVLTDFLHYVKMARSHSVKTEHRAQESVKEHKRILEAIRQRDGDLAEQLANEHIQHVIENLDLH